jgi:hypothetical protein
MKLSVVTGIVDPARTIRYWEGWRHTAGTLFEGHAVLNGVTPGVGVGVANYLLELANPGTLQLHPQILGTVGSFLQGVGAVPGLEAEDTIVALLHDDLKITEAGWGDKILEHFASHPDCGLAGFGGASGVGVEGMYERPFDPMSLVRHDFQSNMRDAEAHGRRVTTPRKVAVLDGFSLVARGPLAIAALTNLSGRGVVHHAYDVYFGVLAKQLGYETWLLPFECHHGGGQTAVANPKYAEWAQKRFVALDPASDEVVGDQAVWMHAHRQVYELSRGVLPFAVEKVD